MLTYVGDPQGPEDIDGTVTVSISHVPTGATEGVVIATNEGLSLPGRIDG